MSKEGNFWSPSFMAEFKKWIDNKEDNNNIIDKGSIVTTNLKLKTLVERIDCIKTMDHSVIDIAKNFLKNGGMVKEVQGDELLIKGKKGLFLINKEDVVLS